MVFTAIKDQVNYKARIKTKLSLSVLSAHLEMQKTLIVFNEFLYYTSNYQELCSNVQKECIKLIFERSEINRRLSSLQIDYTFSTVQKQKIMTQNNAIIKELVDRLPTVDTSNTSLFELNKIIIIPQEKINLIELQDYGKSI